MAYKLGWRKEDTEELHPQINDIPFEPERQFAATFNRHDDGVRAHVKGAPERVLEMLADGPGRWQKTASASLPSRMARRRPTSVPPMHHRRRTNSPAVASSA
jgi:magnesium-transporting ATPase (P-type)